jgi:hypothetical protein
MPEPMPMAAPMPDRAAAADASDDLGDGPGGESELGPTSLAPTLHRGRAARRRQMARWKKTRRRAGVATAVALFGGGVTVASMTAANSGKGTSASAATRDNITPVTLTTNAGPGAVVVPHPDQGGAPAGSHGAPTTHTVKLPQQRTGSPSSRPDVQPTHTSTDNAGSVPISGVHASGSASGDTKSGYSASVPQTSTTTPPTTTTGSTSTGSTSTGSGTATTPPPATTAPSTPPPTTTAPSTPPRQQLCLLIVCLG